MESFSQFNKKSLEEDLKKFSLVLKALKEEKLLMEAHHDKFKEKLSLCENFLDGTYKFTFLIQGDPQCGKTTFLNSLLDDAIIPCASNNLVMIVQYDVQMETPELFTAPLNTIFNYEQQVFEVRPEHLTATGIKGRLGIQSALKEASKNSENPVDGARSCDDLVYIVRYKIGWLEEAIRDEFILNRIQFVELNMSFQIEVDSQKIMTFERILKSQDNGEIFIFDGMKLFTNAVANKYQEIKGKKERGLLVLNRTDTLGSKEHFKKIHKNLPVLCEKLNMKEDEIKYAIEEYEETEEMRIEFFKQSFYEEQKINQDSLQDGDIIHFISALFTYNKNLLMKYKLV